ncbi:MAG: uroporphyrinogen decarboxylase family protein, partial [Candidatus Firestonebacteria bacterium]
RFGDDWGQQQGLIMGPKHWRKFIKPRIARMYKKVHDSGKKVFIHSCGDVEEIFPDLIEIGVDVFNPFQPEAFDVYKIKNKFGSKLTFFGGMSTQKTLPFGTPNEVKSETLKLIKEIGKDGGYIFSPAHATPKDVPIENIASMLEVLRNQK